MFSVIKNLFTIVIPKADKDVHKMTPEQQEGYRRIIEQRDKLVDTVLARILQIIIVVGVILLVIISIKQPTFFG